MFELCRLIAIRDREGPYDAFSRAGDPFEIILATFPAEGSWVVLKVAAGPAALDDELMPLACIPVWYWSPRLLNRLPTEQSSK